MRLALVSVEFLTALAVIALLVGVPLFVLAVIAVVTGYLQHDAEQYLEHLESESPAQDDDR